MQWVMILVHLSLSDLGLYPLLVDVGNAIAQTLTVTIIITLDLEIYNFILDFSFMVVYAALFKWS